MFGLMVMHLKMIISLKTVNSSKMVNHWKNIYFQMCLNTSLLEKTLIWLIWMRLNVGQRDGCQYLFIYLFSEKVEFVWLHVVKSTVLQNSQIKCYTIAWFISVFQSAVGSFGAMTLCKTTKMLNLTKYNNMNSIVI